MRRRHAAPMISVLVAATVASAALAQPKPAARPRLRLDPAKVERFAAIAREKKPPPLPPAPPAEAEVMSVEGQLHSVSDRRALLGVSADEETLAGMPWIKRVARAEEIREGTAWDGRVFLGYDLAIDARAEEGLAAAVGQHVSFELVRDGFGNPRVTAVRIGS